LGQKRREKQNHEQRLPELHGRKMNAELNDYKEQKDTPTIAPKCVFQHVVQWT
jgi:hypothetical protein